MADDRSDHSTSEESEHEDESIALNSDEEVRFLSTCSNNFPLRIL